MSDQDAWKQTRSRGRSGEVRISISVDEANEFLRRLEEDETFRNELQTDPRRILLDYRIDASPEVIPSPVRLPAPEVVRDLRRTLEERNLLGPTGFETQGFLIIILVVGAIPLVAGEHGTG